MTRAADAPASLFDLANAVRVLAMDGVEKAKSGHPGMPMGMADVATVLYTRFLKFDAGCPDWPDRDRFVLSAGHGSMLIYALNYLTGYAAFDIEQLRNFRQLGYRAAGHPELEVAAGIETTTGPLGQGVANAVGLALAERLLNARFGDDSVDHRTYAICSDGDMMEGISHEACSLAGHLGLGRLTVLYDDNGISIDGPTDLSFSDNTARRFEAYGWHVQAVDGHQPAAIDTALEGALADPRPSLICCRTTIGYGAPNKGGKAAAHGAPLGSEENAATRAALGWSLPPFEVPEGLLAAWRRAGSRGRELREAWQARNGDRRADLQTTGLNDAAEAALAALKRSAFAEAPKLATRVASGRVLAAVSPVMPQLIGGSADLTPSNNSRPPEVTDVGAADYGGRYLRFGIREHGMAGALNGMALHGGIVPYGATFLQFSDYCRPSLRLAALMGLQVIHIMTHDSIGLGEDGPTHQPVEQLAALRAIPNLRVFRPADLIETVECWRQALAWRHGPSVLALTRQGLPTVGAGAGGADLDRAARGGYLIAEADGVGSVTLLATGSEVHIALEARARLEAEGIGASVASLPCFELFEDQDEAYRLSVLSPHGGIRVAMEAAVRQSWDRYLRAGDDFVGMSGFGASGPGPELFAHFGLTPQAIVSTAKAALARQ